MPRARRLNPIRQTDSSSGPGLHCALIANVTIRCPSLEGPGENHGRNKKNNETRNSLGQLYGADYSLDDFTTGVAHQRS